MGFFFVANLKSLEICHGLSITTWENVVVSHDEVPKITPQLAQNLQPNQKRSRNVSHVYNNVHPTFNPPQCDGSAYELPVIL